MPRVRRATARANVVDGKIAREAMARNGEGNVAVTARRKTNVEARRHAQQQQTLSTRQRDAPATTSAGRENKSENMRIRYDDVAARGLTKTQHAK